MDMNIVGSGMCAKEARKTGRKWQVCGAVGRKKTVRKPYRGLKAISGKSFCPERD